MADQKITELDALVTPNNSDVMPIVEIGLPQTKKITYSDLLAALKDGIQYPEVNTYADLPTATGSGDIYIVLQGTGVYIVNRKSAGLYYDNGTWARLGNIPAYFDSANFRVYDNADNTKKVALNTNGITTGTTRTLTVPDKSDTIATLTDIPTSVPFDIAIMKRSSTSTAGVTSSLTAINWDTSMIDDDVGGHITYSLDRYTVNTTGVYEVGGTVTAQSGGQRAQFACELRINGVPTGFQRGGAYIRNSGSAYDYWSVEISNEPLSLNATDYVELAVGQTNGGTYGYGGSLIVTLRGQSSMFWIRKIS